MALLTTDCAHCPFTIMKWPETPRAVPNHQDFAHGHKSPWTARHAEDSLQSISVLVYPGGFTKCDTDCLGPPTSFATSFP